jgi:hypothetical protein
MKRRALLLLICLGLSPVLFCSCSGVGGTAANGTSSSYAKVTAGTGGVQWTGGNYVSSVQPEVQGTAGNGTSSYIRPTAGSDGVQWTGGNDVSNVQPEVRGTAGNGTGSNVKPTAGSDGVQWTGGNYASNAPSE